MARERSGSQVRAPSTESRGTSCAENQSFTMGRNGVSSSVPVTKGQDQAVPTGDSGLSARAPGVHMRQGKALYMSPQRSAFRLESIALCRKQYQIPASALPGS